jgi:hypothetical protein
MICACITVHLTDLKYEDFVHELRSVQSTFRLSLLVDITIECVGIIVMLKTHMQGVAGFGF